MIRIALDVNHLRSHVLGLVANRVDDDAAAHGAVRASAASLRGACDLKRLHLRMQRRQVKAENREPDGSGQTSLHKSTTTYIHNAVLQERRTTDEFVDKDEGEKRISTRIGEKTCMTNCGVETPQD